MTIGESDRSVARTLQRQTFVLAYRDAFLLLGVMMLVSILVALCFRYPCTPQLL